MAQWRRSECVGAEAAARKVGEAMNGDSWRESCFAIRSFVRACVRSSLCTHYLPAAGWSRTMVLVGRESRRRRVRRSRIALRTLID